jgi:hypothetical protein
MHGTHSSKTFNGAYKNEKFNKNHVHEACKVWEQKKQRFNIYKDGANGMAEASSDPIADQCKQYLAQHQLYLYS